MKPAAFDYVRPASLPEALRLLSRQGDEALLMAGGQSLVAMMNLRVLTPALIIDIGRLAELRQVSEDEDSVRIGTCVTHAEIEDCRVPDASRGLMPKAASTLAYRAIRNRGTIGGSLVLADPAAEWPTVLTALNAQVVLASERGRRTIDVSEFVTGIYETTIGAGEIMESVLVPKLLPSARWSYVKVACKSGAFADSIAAVVHDPLRPHFRVALGAVNGAPLLLQRTAAMLDVGKVAAGDLQEAITKDLADADRGFDEFQIELHGATAARAISQVL